VVFSTPLARSIGRMRDRLANRSRQAAVIVLTLDTAWLFAVFFAACAFLAAGTYNPFIYFRF
jgi:hypothetical protein